MKAREKYLIRQVLLASGTIVLFVGIVLLLERYIPKENVEKWLQEGSEVFAYVLAFFFFSEATVGLVPPELVTTPMAHFFKENTGGTWMFLSYTLIISALSYGGGVVAYWVGRNLMRARRYKRFLLFFLKKEYKVLLRHGKVLIVLAAVTPIPFSLFCMLLGSLRYDFKVFAIFSLPRFLRVSVYAYLVYWYLL